VGVYSEGVRNSSVGAMVVLFVALLCSPLGWAGTAAFQMLPLPRSLFFLSFALFGLGSVLLIVWLYFLVAAYENIESNFVADVGIVLVRCSVMLFAVELSSGALLWSYSTGTLSFRALPTIHEGRVYVGVRGQQEPAKVSDSRYPPRSPPPSPVEVRIELRKVRLMGIRRSEVPRGQLIGVLDRDVAPARARWRARLIGPTAEEEAVIDLTPELGGRRRAFIALLPGTRHVHILQDKRTVATLEIPLP
jgi:hypothetical protein